MAEKLKHPERLEQLYVRLQAPAGIGSVQTFSGRRLNTAPYGTVEMSAEDAKHLVPSGFIKLAEWRCDKARATPSSNRRSKSAAASAARCASTAASSIPAR